MKKIVGSDRGSAVVEASIYYPVVFIFMVMIISLNVVRLENFMRITEKREISNECAELLASDGLYKISGGVGVFSDIVNYEKDAATLDSYYEKRVEGSWLLLNNSYDKRLYDVNTFFITSENTNSYTGGTSMKFEKTGCINRMDLSSETNFSTFQMIKPLLNGAETYSFRDYCIPSFSAEGGEIVRMVKMSQSDKYETAAQVQKYKEWIAAQ